MEWATSCQRTEERPQVDRDNPGAWRSHYGTYPRYMGGNKRITPMETHLNALINAAMFAALGILIFVIALW
jgi:hypothetical protein